MPTARLWAYVKMMPRLEAERSLTQITDAAAAFGSMKDEDQSRYMQQLRHSAGGGRRRQRSSAAALAGLGIQIETIE